MEKESFTRAQIDEPLWTTEVLTSLPQGGAITQVQNVMFCNGECEIASYKDCAPKINTPFYSDRYKASTEGGNVHILPKE